ncbi:hypothetical protein, partial [Actinomyces viscosus]|uniref:hypothetical protein n=1 Tax=Actinomyces viscosus TaxID=1656 RepID=UPI001ADCC901
MTVIEFSVDWVVSSYPFVLGTRADVIRHYDRPVAPAPDLASIFHWLVEWGVGGVVAGVVGAIMPV